MPYNLNSELATLMYLKSSFVAGPFLNFQKEHMIDIIQMVHVFTHKVSPGF